MKIVETLLRLSALEGVLGNWALSGAKHTVLLFNATTPAVYDLSPFDTALDSAVGVQVCSFFDFCDKDPRWVEVPTHAVPASRLIDRLAPEKKAPPADQKVNACDFQAYWRPIKSSCFRMRKSQVHRSLPSSRKSR